MSKPNGNPAFGRGVTQAWFPEELDENDPLRGNPEDEDVVAILRELHRPAADAFQDIWETALTAQDRKYWR
jgi:hypothetical protein